ncbi:MAG: type II toxin-antitoxin system PemK/MazF family toxin [Planctomycetes bacterium]|nr:type II toxin-antitoxin system PemK/MazF family toxin [Planctomycetota bacterium]
MARFVKGSVVILNYPFTDLSGFKKRPALVITSLPGNNLILCPISSRRKIDGFSIEIKKSDFKEGNLYRSSVVLSAVFFTVDHDLVISEVGKLKNSKLEEVIEFCINALKYEGVENGH